MTKATWQNYVSIAYQNIDGLFFRISGQRFCKLQEDNFQELSNKFDIIGLVETHCGPRENLSLDGYKIHHVHRPKSINSTRHYGGIAVCIKTCIQKGIKIIPHTNTEIQWLKLCKHFFHMDNDLYIAFVYISPARSSYSHQREDIFEILENDVAKYSKLGSCLVFGDFNARTATAADFCIESDTGQHLPDNYIYDEPLPRNNLDKHDIDNHGTQLLSFCRTSALRILNGRTVGDSLGQCTCYSFNGKPSTIDYALASGDILKSVEYFYVHSPNDLSIHCTLSTMVKTRPFILPPDKNNDTLHPLPGKFIWEKGSDLQYQEAFLHPDIKHKISAFLSNESEVTSDEALETVQDIIKSAAQIAEIRKRRPRAALDKQPKRKKFKKKWFDQDCLNLRKDLHKVGKSLHKDPYNLQLHHRYLNLRKNYKRKINKKRAEYKEGILQQMDNLKENNPNAFWKLYDQLKGLDKSHKSNPIPASEFHQHFTSLMADAQHKQTQEFEQHMEDYIDSNKDKIFNDLNFRITEIEISRALSKLKNGKASGTDEIPNEMLKAGNVYLTSVFHKLFNVVFTTGGFPEVWRSSTLTPLHKKGSIYEPGNYRGIAIGSSLCKLFCSILQNRLSLYVKEQDIIPQNQIGYRAQSRTSDHILSLRSLIDRYVNRLGKQSYLFTCFVDFKSAFDTISRRALFYKLLKLGVGGNFLNILQAMYSTVFYHIKLPDGLTDPVTSNIGVKQGCVMSPTLFNIFLHDLPTAFDNSCHPAALYNTDISCLMFADDLVLISESSTGLQMCLNKLEQYCDKWGLTVNLNKTKVMIFNKTGKVLNKYKFYYKNVPVDITNEYCYLGIIFTPSGTFTQAINRLTDQATKALFKLKQLDTVNNIPIALKLFDILIMPILRYCSEIWTPYFIKNLNAMNLLSLGDKLPVEKVHLKFCKFLLGVNRRTTNIAVRAELGRRPILLDLIIHSTNYWIYITKLDPERLVYKTYLDLYSANTANWANYVKNIWHLFDLSSIWSNQGTKYRHKVRRILTKNIIRNYDAQWNALMNKEDSKLRTYRLIKTVIGTENYLLGHTCLTSRREFTRLRLSAHQLRVETGRHTSPKTPWENRLCRHCTAQSVETEEHLWLSCSLYLHEREQLIQTLDSFTTFSSLTTDQEKLIFLMSYHGGDTEVARVVQKYVNACILKRKLYSQTTV